MPQVKTPWADAMGEIPLHLTYFEGSMLEAVENTAADHPDLIAFDFMGRGVGYPRLIREIRRCAKALLALGVKPGDRVTLALPNCPQALYLFYGVNAVGAVANMIHPLSAEKEISFYLTASHSKVAVTLDQFGEKFLRAAAGTPLETLVITGIGDALTGVKKLGYALTLGRKIPKLPKGAPILPWRDFLAGAEKAGELPPPPKGGEVAVILYSGGTTGTTKGILLTNRNFNALGSQIVATNPMFRPGDRMLAAMPLFHGFGLGVCIHSMLSQGGRCILVPRFTPKSYAGLIEKARCNFIAGVPTLYEALLRLPGMEKADFSSLKGVFSGGDSLSVELKKRLDAFLAAHRAPVQVREGYGTTETVTACCLTPPDRAKEGSIGIPFPDTYIKIVRPGTEEELPYGEEGEILLAGPTVMQGYADAPEETAATLRTHADGLTWVYTGDLGYMDGEGFVYFRGRAKRMIVTSGYNVYPAQIENLLDAHPMVQMSCVIGVPDPYKIRKVKAFVTLKQGVAPTEETRRALMDYCRLHVARYAMPCQIEFRETLPKTLVGKVAYRQLEEEEAAKGPANA